MPSPITCLPSITSDLPTFCVQMTRRPLVLMTRRPLVSCHAALRSECVPSGPGDLPAAPAHLSRPSVAPPAQRRPPGAVRSSTASGPDGVITGQCGGQMLSRAGRSFNKGRPNLSPSILKRRGARLRFYISMILLARTISVQGALAGG